MEWCFTCKTWQLNNTGRPFLMYIFRMFYIVSEVVFLFPRITSGNSHRSCLHKCSSFFVILISTTPRYMKPRYIKIYQILYIYAYNYYFKILLIKYITNCYILLCILSNFIMDIDKCYQYHEKRQWLIKEVSFLFIRLPRKWKLKIPRLLHT